MNDSRQSDREGPSAEPQRKRRWRRLGLRVNLSQRIPFLVVAAALVSGAVVAIADYRQAATELSRSAETNLLALLDARRVAIVDYLASIRRDLRTQATSPFVLEAFSGFKKGWEELGDAAPVRLPGLYVEANPYPAAARKQLNHADDPSLYSLNHGRFHPRLRDFVEQYGYRDLLFVDMSGRVIYSVMKLSDFAADLKDAANRDSGLALAYRRAATRPAYGAESFVDFSFYGPAAGRPAGFVARPLLDEFGVKIGIIVFEMPIDRINRVMNVRSGMGRTGETFIAGPDLLMRSDSRFSSESTILARRVDSGPVKAALEGRSGVMTSAGTREGEKDETFLSAYAPFDFLGTRWAIVASANLAEVNAPVKRMRNRAILNGLLLTLSVAVVGYLLTRTSVVGPLTHITGAVRRLAAGDRESGIPSVERGDEIGDIARALVLFRDKLVETARDSAEFERQAKAEEVRRKLTEAIEATRDGFVLIDPNDHIIVVNSRYREMFAPSAHLLVPGIRFDIFLRHLAESGAMPEAVGRVDAFVSERISHLRDSTGPLETRLANGTWLLTVNSRTEDGGAVSVCSDISDLKRREHALVNSEDRYRLLVDTLPDGVMLHDAKEMKFINAVGRQILEIPDDVSIEGLNYRDFVDDSEKVTADKRLHENLDFGKTSPLAERKIRTYKGRHIVIEIAAVPFRRGPSALGLAVFRDITDRKRTELRLRESEGQVRAIVEAAADAIVMLDARGRIVDINPTAERIFGREPDGVRGKIMADVLIDRDHRSKFKRILRSAAMETAHARDASRSEIEAVRNDGVAFPAELTVRPVAVEGRRLFTAFVRDLTETRQAQKEIERQREALYQSEKLTALGSLLAGVAHELNNPLSIVVAQAMLMEETSAEKRVVGRAKEIRSAAERCARIVRTFLSMARQETPAIGPVDLNGLVKNGLELLGYALRTTDIEVVKELDSDLPEIWGDADQLHQVVANLVINALQAMSENRRLRRLVVATAIDVESGMVRLTFDDSGPGVPAEMRTRIFDPFFTTKPIGIGTGIGLAVCHGIVESHGGTIAVEASAGGGARFVVLLPADAQAAARPLPVVAGAAAHNVGQRILVVDDEVEIAVALAEILRLDGLRVDVANSGPAALDRLAMSEYDLILTDLRMPKMDGPGFYRRLAERHPHLRDRVIVVTGDTLNASASEFMKRTELPMIEKPFDPPEVLRLVSEMLARTGEGKRPALGGRADAEARRETAARGRRA